MKPKRFITKKTAVIPLLFIFMSCATNFEGYPSRNDINISTVSMQPGDKVENGVEDKKRERVQLTLEKAIVLAMLNNPKLKALYSRFEQESLRFHQVTTLQDPKISYAQFVENIQTRTGEQEFILGISQMFPWFGKLQLQEEIAEANALKSLEDYRFAMLDLRKQVSETIYRLVYQLAANELAKEDRNTLQQSLDAVTALYTTAQRGRESLLKVQTELARIENELVAFPSKITALRAKLSNLLHDERYVEIAQPLPKYVLEDMHFQEKFLLETAKQNSPEIQQINYEKEIANLQYDLARKDYYPDVTFGMNYIGIGDSPANPSDEGEDAWNIAVSFNIPLPNAKRKANLRISNKQKLEAKYQLESKVDTIEQEIAAVVAELQALRNQQEILQTNLIPLAKETFDASRISYESGQATFLDLLDAQRTYISVRADLLKINRDYRIAISRFERILGGQIDLFVTKEPKK